jgi:hypothetical protein
VPPAPTLVGPAPSPRHRDGGAAGLGSVPLDDLTDDQIADIVWTMNSAEYWDLLVRERSWTPEAFETHLADAWIRLLLTPRTTAPPQLGH